MLATTLEALVGAVFADGGDPAVQTLVKDFTLLTHPLLTPKNTSPATNPPLLDPIDRFIPPAHDELVSIPFDKETASRLPFSCVSFPLSQVPAPGYLNACKRSSPGASSFAPRNRDRARRGALRRGVQSRIERRCGVAYALACWGQLLVGE
ncbi:hypothetical protein LEMA_P068550.1 [Plenodomus lingam JN3]|uniref:RNase III domain-containing protein n=1 Tax=Leptosphaeria maculans (strain JN3 / isolate v23.1.3 / race Av1-4-5-6-7-8) TaxID=985895 RepID=E4ZJR2_LEPMJ|nr:hypothetical protein LEMA_P068550.1 [Plenodomus lingam JN3]CBX91347.1 hypothetical protein LEMA_P068550.1 [Plenodomus lingam JN3]